MLNPLLDQNSRPLLPASSLKGVLRATSERILRSCDPGNGEQPFACIPFVAARPENATPTADEQPATLASSAFLGRSARRSIACSELVDWHKALDDEPPPGGIYNELCLACQLFGSTVHGGLLCVEDAVPVVSARAERSHVAIDRLTGGVGEGPFIESLVRGGQPLQVDLALINFALWQLGLLALALQELQRGYVALGGGTRKGQGQVGVKVEQIAINYARPFYGDKAGIVSAQPEFEAESPLPLAGAQPITPTGWYEQDQVRFLFAGEAAATALLTACVAGPWQRRIGAAGGQRAATT